MVGFFFFTVSDTYAFPRTTSVRYFPACILAMKKQFIPSHDARESNKLFWIFSITKMIADFMLPKGMGVHC